VPEESSVMEVGLTIKLHCYVTGHMVAAIGTWQRVIFGLAIGK
jgi:hypothetical protein